MRKSLIVGTKEDVAKYKAMGEWVIQVHNLLTKPPVAEKKRIITFNHPSLENM